LSRSTPIEVRPVAGRADLDRFIKLPWRVYADDPLWVAPLITEVREVLNPVKHPFYRHGDVETFLAFRNGEVVGRIAAIVNRAHNEFHGDRMGFFGLFESIDDQAVANALLQRAEAWLSQRGCDRSQGPMNLSTNEELCSPGVLVDGFDQPPVIMMAHTPPYYARLLENAGYLKAKDLLSFWNDGDETPERLERAVGTLTKRHKVTVRSLDLKDFDGELERIKKVYNSAWERNWGFVPMTEEEFSFMAKKLRPILDPRMCLLVEHEAEPIAFALQLPDYNQALKHVNGRLLPIGVFKFLWHKRKIRSVRVLTLGVRPEWRHKGIDALLIAKMHHVLQPLDMPRGEGSWVLEDNYPMRNAMERMGAFVYKTYRVFEKPLSTP
jgi:GNAT superfamily N-acetyltransferase